MREDEMNLNVEQLDEQLNALADAAAYAPPATLLHQPDARLIHDLQGLHAPAAREDAISLARVHLRLREREELVSAGLSPAPLNSQLSQKQSHKGLQKMQYNTYAEQHRKRSFAHPLFNALAAVFVVALLGTVLGSFYYWFEAHPGKPASGQTPAAVTTPKTSTPTTVPAATTGLYHVADDTLSKVDPQTGTAIWQKTYPVLLPVRGFRVWATSDTTVFLAYQNENGQYVKIYALNAQNGAELWNYTPGNPIIGPLVSSHSVVYFATAPYGSDGPGKATVIALDMAHGGVRWQRPLGRQLFTALPSPSGDILVAANGLLYVNAQTTILALDAQNGSPAWQTAPGQVTETYDSLVVTAGRFYVIAHADGRQYVESFDALHGNSPRALQGLDGALAGDLAFANGVVYALTTANLGSTGPYHYILSAVDPTSGSVLWSYKGSGSGAQLSVANGRAIIAYDTTDAQGKNIEGLQTVNLQTHSGSWQRVLHQGEQQTIAFTLLGGTIYTASSAGTLTALRATDGTVIWQQ